MAYLSDSHSNSSQVCNSIFSILLLNIWFLAKNLPPLLYIVDTRSPDFLSLQETWLDSCTDNFIIPGYTVVSRRHRITDSLGGGVIAYRRGAWR